MPNQAASASADLREHGGGRDRRTVPRLLPHSPPCGNPCSGPGQQRISCQQSLNVQADFHHLLLLQKSGQYAS